MAEKPNARAARRPPAPKRPPANDIVPIVGIGASAGGIEAVSELLRNLPDDPGMAFVLIQHQAPSRVSGLAQVLGRATPLPVQAAMDGESVKRNVVYVAPADSDLNLTDGTIRLLARDAHTTMPIDVFFRSLAADQGSRAIGVILSGAASDGALGAKAIKAEGGITFAQDESAKFDSMPHSAIIAGAIDFILPPEKIAKELGRIARHAYLVGPESARHLPDGELGSIFALLHAAHDVDFTHYKPATLERRIRRRMALRKVENVRSYVALLQEEPGEIEQLYADILIRVTGFFRDPDVFETLKRDIAPKLALVRAGDETPIRIWVPGCATGEEVYSLAMAFLEAIPDGHGCPVQIFGTDISDSSIDRARAGFYPENIALEVSPERLRRFFVRDEGGYRINKAVRDCCVFARQDLTKDPPFSKLDLISCRNVMIYLGNVLQRRVMSIFHYALRNDGYLVLGSSESVGSFDHLFTLVDRKHKIYQKVPVVNHRLALDLTLPSVARERPARPAVGEEIVTVPNILREADRVLLARFSPAGVIVNDQMEIVQFRGRTSPYLEPAPGTASFNLLKMAREGLLAELRNAISTARRKEAPVRRGGVRVTTNGHVTVIDLEVIPFFGSAHDCYFAILFEPASIPLTETAKGGRKGAKAKAAEDPRLVARLKRELEATREYLQSIIEEQEAMNEELRSANEEIQSSNEELQSTNEELETAKEELQSSNEELITLNEELENRADELALVNNDLLNLLASVDIAIVMLDAALRIRRFNSGAQRVLNLIPADLGRSIAELKTPLELDHLDEMIAGVIEKLELRESEVRDRSGHPYILRLRPYKTMDNKIDGAVLVLIDVEQWKRS
jgi:two-component system CheB/CheR fusion protein